MAACTGSPPRKPRPVIWRACASWTKNKNRGGRRYEFQKKRLFVCYLDSRHPSGGPPLLGIQGPTSSEQHYCKVTPSRCRARIRGEIFTAQKMERFFFRQILSAESKHLLVCIHTSYLSLPTTRSLSIIRSRTFPEHASVAPGALYNILSLQSRVVRCTENITKCVPCACPKRVQWCAPKR